MKGNYQPGVPVPEPDHSRWLALIMRTPWHDVFVQHGIDHFEVRETLQRPGFTEMVVVNGRRNDAL